MNKVILGFLLFAFLGANAQKAALNRAERLYDKLSYDRAKEMYKESVEKGIDSAAVYEHIANSYYFNSDLIAAEPWYQILVERYPITDAEHLFRYAHTLKAKKQYAKADSIMQRFLEAKPTDSRAIAFDAQRNYLSDLNLRANRFTIKNIGINTKFSEFGPAFYQDGVVFASDRYRPAGARNVHTWSGEPFLDLYGALINKKGGLYDAVNFSNKVNTRFHESTAAFSPDGQTMYFTRNNYTKKLKRDSEGIARLKLYRATKTEKGWGDVYELPFNSDEFSIAHPAVSPDGTKLYFVSDMPGTLGASDIFVADIFSDGTYSGPRNLGSNINTEGRDSFPYVSPDGRFYFASDGHVGFGGLDVFLGDLEGSRPPYNLGIPVNSPQDDFSFIINPENKRGYLSSNRVGGRGRDDIYLIEQVKPLLIDCDGSVSGITRDAADRPIEGVQVRLLDSKSNEIASVLTGEDGWYRFDVPCENEVFIVAGEKEDYKSAEVVARVEANNAVVTQDLTLARFTFEIGTDLKEELGIEQIYFDTGRDEIRPDAAVELDKLVSYLLEYPSVKIDVRSHTDSRGGTKSNKRLSDRRANSTVAYIISRGVAPERVSGSGYGESQLINDCNDFKRCSEEEHQQNRRSEFIVIAN